MSDPQAPNGWSRYEALVLDKLASIEDRLDRLERSAVEAAVERAGLRVKVGVWGAVGASIPAAIAIIWTLLR